MYLSTLGKQGVKVVAMLNANRAASSDIKYLVNTSMTIL